MNESHYTEKICKVNANTAFHPVVFCKLSQNQQNVFNNIVDSLGFSFPAWPRRHAGYPPAGGYGFHSAGAAPLQR